MKSSIRSIIKLSIKSSKRPSTTVRSDPELWAKIVKQVKKSNKGAKPNQWSARKAQYAVKLYMQKGGTYLSSKNKTALHKWTKQNWRTRSGKPSILGPLATGERYLPSKVIKKLSKKQYDYTSKLKKMSKKQYTKVV